MYNLRPVSDAKIFMSQTLFKFGLYVNCKVCLLIQMSNLLATPQPFLTQLCKLLAKYVNNNSGNFFWYMKSVAESMLFMQSCSRFKIPGQARKEERLGRSKLKEPFLTDSDAKLFMYLIQGVRFHS